MLTIEQKAKIFDLLVEEVNPLGECIGTKLVFPRPSLECDLTGEDIQVQEVNVYEWKLRSDGCMNFVDACINLLKEYSYLDV